MYYKARKLAIKPYVVFDKVAKDKQECIARQFCKGTTAADGSFVPNDPFELKEGVLHQDDLPAEIYGVCEQQINEEGHLVPISSEQLASAQIAYEKEQRAIAFAAIDADTQAQIAKGFGFDGQWFSLSQAAQLNWQGLFLLHQAGLFEDQQISTLEGGVYRLTASNVQGFIQAGSTVLIQALKAGRDKKQMV